jgi:hypothetical protein
VEPRDTTPLSVRSPESFVLVAIKRDIRRINAQIKLHGEGSQMAEDPIEVVIQEAIVLEGGLDHLGS